MSGTPSDPQDYRLSVVMPVYAGADAQHFARALESIYAQTHPAAEVIVVEDGPLTDAHYAVLDSFAGREPELRRVALPENRGAAAGNDAGLRAARYPWIVKADSDDVNLPGRFAEQVEALHEGEMSGAGGVSGAGETGAPGGIGSTGGIDCLGAAMYEFDGDEANIVGVRRLPRTHEQIARYMRRNNPLNHPTVIYRRELALEVGGYQALAYMEDYDLMARMLAAGARMRNLDEPLVAFRAGEAMLGRRKAPGIVASERIMARNLRAYGLAGPVESRVNLAARIGFRLLPATALARVYRVLFRRGA